MQAGGFCASVARRNGVVVVRVAGELDLANAPQLQEVLRTCHGPTVVDCTDLTFIDSSGIATLVEAHRSNGTITLRHLTPMCRKVIDIGGLKRLVALEER